MLGIGVAATAANNSVAVSCVHFERRRVDIGIIEMQPHTSWRFGRNASYPIGSRPPTTSRSPATNKRAVSVATLLDETFSGPNGIISSGFSMNFTHWASTSVTGWMYHVIGGITLAEPGFGVIDIRPVCGPVPTLPSPLSSAITARSVPVGLRTEWV
ncbi:hypothetical protein HJFPF1_00147 [Paramyrothecium foliicola]|nr:hypothetical protein HJFPF1_00147 [Paramyrothecium foliicola]